jgi:Glutamine amidotransferase class-I
LPDAFEVARYHSLHGIKERLPSCLTVTALSEDGIVMAIQHNILPFAAVQFHPESILTSPAHGMAILENALSVLHYPASEEEKATSGAALVGILEGKSESQLRETLGSVGLSTSGSKSEMVVRLALWTHKSSEAKAGRLHLMNNSIAELRELKASLGLKGSSSTKEELLELLNGCLIG